jgi:hypothetical protein
MWSVIIHFKGEILSQVSGNEVLRKIYGHADSVVNGSSGIMSGI